MPAIHYRVRWPDASESHCYSPSLAIQDQLSAGTDYALGDFLLRVRAATEVANERVQAKYGFVCSRANDQLVATEARASLFADEPGARVQVLGFEPA